MGLSPYSAPYCVVNRGGSRSEGNCKRHVLGPRLGFQNAKNDFSYHATCMQLIRVSRLEVSSLSAFRNLLPSYGISNLLGILGLQQFPIHANVGLAGSPPQGTYSYCTIPKLLSHASPLRLLAYAYVPSSLGLVARSFGRLRENVAALTQFSNPLRCFASWCG